MNEQQAVSDTIWMDILVNQKIALKNIYYDFDKWDILPESAKELDKLVSLMKENPGNESRIRFSYRRPWHRTL